MGATPYQAENGFESSPPGVNGGHGVSQKSYESDFQSGAESKAGSAQPYSAREADVGSSRPVLMGAVVN